MACFLFALNEPAASRLSVRQWELRRQFAERNACPSGREIVLPARAASIRYKNSQQSLPAIFKYPFSSSTSWTYRYQSSALLLLTIVREVNESPTKLCVGIPAKVLVSEVQTVPSPIVFSSMKTRTPCLAAPCKISLTRSGVTGISYSVKLLVYSFYRDAGMYQSLALRRHEAVFVRRLEGWYRGNGNETGRVGDGLEL